MPDYKVRQVGVNGVTPNEFCRPTPSIGWIRWLPGVDEHCDGHHQSSQEIDSRPNTVTAVGFVSIRPKARAKNLTHYHQQGCQNKEWEQPPHPSPPLDEPVAERTGPRSQGRLQQQTNASSRRTYRFSGTAHPQMSCCHEGECPACDGDGPNGGRYILGVHALRRRLVRQLSWLRVSGVHPTQSAGRDVGVRRLTPLTYRAWVT